jgi:hypothetical protein
LRPDEAPNGRRNEYEFCHHCVDVDLIAAAGYGASEAGAEWQ